MRQYRLRQPCLYCIEPNEKQTNKQKTSPSLSIYFNTASVFKRQIKRKKKRKQQQQQKPIPHPQPLKKIQCTLHFHRLIQEEEELER